MSAKRNDKKKKDTEGVRWAVDPMVSRRNRVHRDRSKYDRQSEKKNVRKNLDNS